jgi:hypothetical protein
MSSTTKCVSVCVFMRKRENACLRYSLALFEKITNHRGKGNQLLTYLSFVWDKTVGCNTGFHITCIDKQCKM